MRRRQLAKASIPTPTGRRVPGVRSPRLKELLKYRVNIPDIIEVIYEPLYDLQTYPLAGQSTFTFFQRQIGANGATLSDTNLDIPGLISKGRTFLVTGLEVNFYPGADALANANAPDVDFFSSVYDVLTSSASINLRIGSKSYFRQAPLVKCPPEQYLYVIGDTSNGIGASGFSYASGMGDPMDVVDLRLESTQNFDVSINFTNPVPVATETGRLGVTLRGFLFRNAQ